MTTRGSSWRLNARLRDWQTSALASWQGSNRGIVSVVTGAGKTFFALKCIEELHREKPESLFLIVVPTIALLDQWYVELTETLGVHKSEIGLLGGGQAPSEGNKVVVAVLNSARQYASRLTANGDWILIVDECHRAASFENRRVLEGRYAASLGLTATPRREFDTWFEDYVEPAIGPIIFEYDYSSALRDGVLSPFELWNVRIPVTESEQSELEKANRRIAQLFDEGHNPGEHPLKAALLKRASISKGLKARVPAAVALSLESRDLKQLVFHESIAAADDINRRLLNAGVRAAVYHSRVSRVARLRDLTLFRRNQLDTIVACRALDEGLDVPGASFGVIAASTRSTRQRIQRLGRVLRPHPEKDRAIVATLYALNSDEERLLEEATHLEGVASVRWFEAS